MAEETTQPRQGALVASLTRNPSQVQADRAEQIVRSSKLNFARKIEDQKLALQEMKNRQSAMLDLSPNNTQCIINVKDFNAENFVANTTVLADAIVKKADYVAVLEDEFVRLFGESPKSIL